MTNLNEEIKNQILIEFGKNIRKIREEKKMSQLDLAMFINEDENKIESIEQGKCDLDMLSLFAIAQAFDVKPAELFKIKNIEYFKKNILKDSDNKWFKGLN